MPRFIVDISQNTYDRVDLLLKEGAHGSFSDFARAAIENQLTLEAADNQPAATASAREADVPKSIPAVKLSALPVGHAVAPELPDAQLVYPDTDPDALYLWGQINRLFPVKVALRVLWQLTENGPVSLEKLRADAPIVARAIGLWIKQAEDAAGVRRSDSHWVGMPIGTSADKSIARFRSHFVGYPRSRDGIFEGALFRLKLAGVKDGAVAMTELGGKWASLANPILDGASALGPSFSPEEVESYLRNVAERVPEERRPLSETLDLIKTGAVETRALDVELTRKHPGWTENVVTTMRSGNLSRLWELGLISRTGPFGASIFSLTDAGESFLASVSS